MTADKKQPKQPKTQAQPKQNQAPARYGGPFKLRPTPEAQQNLADLERNPAMAAQAKAAKKALGFLQQDPHYPSLNSHIFHSRRAPGGEQVWESYAQNNTPGAYRIFWYYGPGENEITVFSIRQHP